jgi:hypothetical protein
VILAVAVVMGGIFYWLQHRHGKSPPPAAPPA